MFPLKWKQTSSVHSSQNKRASFISNSCAKPSLFSDVCTSSIYFFKSLKEDSERDALYQCLLLSTQLSDHGGTINSWGRENVTLNDHNDHPRAPQWGWEGKLGPCHAHCGQNKVSPQMHILGAQFVLLAIQCQNSLLLRLIASGLQSDLVQVPWDFYSTLKMTQHLASRQKLCIRMIMYGSCVTLSKSTLALFPVWKGTVKVHLLLPAPAPNGMQSERRKNKQKNHLFQKWHKKQFFPF